MNIFLMLITFLFMAGYYYMQSPSLSFREDSREVLAETAGVKSILACVSQVHFQSLKENDVNLYPHNHQFKNDSGCAKKYKITSKKICMKGDRLTPECYPDVANAADISHYVITKSAVLDQRDTGKVLDLLRRDYRHASNLGMMMVSEERKPILVSAAEVPLEVSTPVFSAMSMRTGDLVYYSQYNKDEILAQMRNNEMNRVTCVGNEIKVYRYRQWICEVPSENALCIGDMIYDRNVGGCVMDESKKPVCPGREEAVSINNLWVCVPPQMTIKCESPLVAQLNFQTFEWECIFDPDRIEDSTECTSSKKDQLTGEISSEIIQITAGSSHCTDCEIFDQSDGRCNNTCTPNPQRISNPSCYNPVIDCTNTDSQNPTKAIYFGFPKYGTGTDAARSLEYINNAKKTIRELQGIDSVILGSVPSNNRYFNCLDCGSLRINKKTLVLNMFAECDYSGTHYAICSNGGKDPDNVYVIDPNANDPSNKNKGGCKNLDDVVNVVPPCPDGFYRKNKSESCRPKFCNSNDGVGNVCPSDRPVMVLTQAGKNNETCVYCWRPSIKIPGLASANISITPNVGSTKINGTYSANIAFDWKATLSSKQSEAIPDTGSDLSLFAVTARMNTKKQIKDSVLRFFGGRNTNAEDIFDANGNYIDLIQSLNWGNFSGTNMPPLPIPIPQDKLTTLYNNVDLGGLEYNVIPCAVKNANGYCVDSDLSLDSSKTNGTGYHMVMPGYVRKWSGNDWTTSWWLNDKDDKSNQTLAKDSVLKCADGDIMRVFGKFTDSGDLAATRYCMRPIPLANDIPSDGEFKRDGTKIGGWQDSTVDYMSFGQKQKTTTDDYKNKLFPYYGCLSTSNNDKVIQTGCSPCYDVVKSETVVFNEYEKVDNVIRKKTTSPYNQIFNAVDVLSVKTGTITTPTTLNVGSGRQTVSGNNNTIYIKPEKCSGTEFLDDKTTETRAGCPAGMIRYWGTDHYWTPCYYNMCGATPATNISWAKSLAGGTLGGFVYVLTRENNTRTILYENGAETEGGTPVNDSCVYNWRPPYYYWTVNLSQHSFITQVCPNGLCSTPSAAASAVLYTAEDIKDNMQNVFSSSQSVPMFADVLIDEKMKYITSEQAGKLTPCPTGSYHYWNDHRGWSDCMYNVIPDDGYRNTTVSSNDLWGDGLNDHGGTVWNPGMETLSQYVNRNMGTMGYGANIPLTGDPKELEGVDGRIVVIYEPMADEMEPLGPVAGIYLWDAPAWVSIENQAAVNDPSYIAFVDEDTSASTSNSFLRVQSLFGKQLSTKNESEPSNTVVGRKSHVTFAEFYQTAMDPTKLSDKLDSKDNVILGSDEKPIQTTNISGLSDQVLSPKHIHATAKKIKVALQSSDIHPNFAGKQRLFRQDIEEYALEKYAAGTHVKLENIKKQNPTNATLNDYGCPIGTRMTHDDKNFEPWNPICLDINYCKNVNPSGKEGYIKVAKEVENDYCIDFVMPRPDETEDFLDGDGECSTMDAATMKTGPALGINELDPDGCNYRTYDCTKQKNDDPRCNPPSDETIGKNIALYRGIPGVYQYFGKVDNKWRWSEPIANWCTGAEPSSETAGYVPTYFHDGDNDNPFTPSTLKLGNGETVATTAVDFTYCSRNDLSVAPRIKCQKVDVPIYAVTAPLSQPCISMWKPSYAQATTLNWSDKIGQSAIATDANNFHKNELTQPSQIHAVDINTSGLECSDVSGCSTNSNDNFVNSTLPVNNGITYSNAYLHRFNDADKIVWNFNMSPVFCADLRENQNTKLQNNKLNKCDTSINGNLLANSCMNFTNLTRGIFALNIKNLTEPCITIIETVPTGFTGNKSDYLVRESINETGMFVTGNEAWINGMPTCGGTSGTTSGTTCNFGTIDFNAARKPCLNSMANPYNNSYGLKFFTYWYDDSWSNNDNCAVEIKLPTNIRHLFIRGSENKDIGFAGDDTTALTPDNISGSLSSFAQKYKKYFLGFDASANANEFKLFRPAPTSSEWTNGLGSKTFDIFMEATTNSDRVATFSTYTDDACAAAGNCVTADNKQAYVLGQPSGWGYDWTDDAGWGDRTYNNVCTAATNENSDSKWFKITSQYKPGGNATCAVPHPNIWAGTCGSECTAITSASTPADIYKCHECLFDNTVDYTPTYALTDTKTTNTYNQLVKFGAAGWNNPTALGNFICPGQDVRTTGTAPELSCANAFYSAAAETTYTGNDYAALGPTGATRKCFNCLYNGSCTDGHTYATGPTAVTADVVGLIHGPAQSACDYRVLIDSTRQTKLFKNGKSLTLCNPTNNVSYTTYNAKLTDEQQMTLPAAMRDDLDFTVNQYYDCTATSLGQPCTPGTENCFGSILYNSNGNAFKLYSISADLDFAQNKIGGEKYLDLTNGVLVYANTLNESLGSKVSAKNMTSVGLNWGTSFTNANEDQFRTTWVGGSVAPAVGCTVKYENNDYKFECGSTGAFYTDGCTSSNNNGCINLMGININTNLYDISSELSTLATFGTNFTDLNGDALTAPYIGKLSIDRITDATKLAVEKKLTTELKNWMSVDENGYTDLDANSLTAKWIPNTAGTTPTVTCSISHNGSNYVFGTCNQTGSFATSYTDCTGLGGAPTDCLTFGAMSAIKSSLYDIVAPTTSSSGPNAADIVAYKTAFGFQTTEQSTTYNLSLSTRALPTATGLANDFGSAGWTKTYSYEINKITATYTKSGQSSQSCEIQANANDTAAELSIDITAMTDEAWKAGYLCALAKAGSGQITFGSSVTEIHISKAMLDTFELKYAGSSTIEKQFITSILVEGVAKIDSAIVSDWSSCPTTRTEYDEIFTILRTYLSTPLQSSLRTLRSSSGIVCSRPTS